MIKFIILIVLGYIIQLLAQTIEVVIMKRMGTKEITAENTLMISIIGYLIFVFGFLILFYSLYF